MTKSWSELTLKERVDWLVNQLQISSDKIAQLETRVSELEAKLRDNSTSE